MYFPVRPVDIPSCSYTAPSGDSDWTANIALGIAFAFAKLATGTAASAAQRVINPSLDLGSGLCHLCSQGTWRCFAKLVAMYIRVGLAGAWTGRDWSLGYGTCRDPSRVTPHGLDPSLSPSLCPCMLRGTSYSCPLNSAPSHTNYLIRDS